MKKINRQKYHVKPYPHFDSRIPITNLVEKNLNNPSYIATHSFYPFIHYTKVTCKYNKVERKLIPKNREIFYAGHMDGYIFKYYGDKLNCLYNKYCIDNGINKVSIAYRNNKKGMNNIKFASEVIKFISNQKNAFIYVTDFTSYFDNLDHELLKERLLEVLGIKSNKLPSDWWNIFKNITRYSWIEKYDIEKYLLETKGIDIKKTEEIERYLTPKEFREFRKRGVISQNEKGFGIPQGSPISAVLANVYAIHLDIELNEYTKKYGGIYRRYSDDIILVFPFENEKKCLYHKNKIESIIHQNKIQASEEKTKSLYFYNKKIYKDAMFQKESKLDYLGFSFDGYTIKIREKSLYKYYNRMYKKIYSIKKAEKKEGRKIGRKKLYLIYSHFGRRYKGYGNFISYAERAHKEFSKNNQIESKIYNQIKRHWKKIYKRLND